MKNEKVRQCKECGRLIENTGKEYCKDCEKKIYFCPLCEGEGVVEKQVTTSPVALEPMFIQINCPLCMGEGVLYLNKEQKEIVEKEWGELQEIEDLSDDVKYTSIDEIEF